MDHYLIGRMGSVLCLSFLLAACGGGQDTPSDPPPTEDLQKYAAEPTVSLYRKDSGAIEEYPLEDYIVGVVAGEVGGRFPDEALKAQAIVARTMTLTLIEYEGDIQKKHGADASDDHTEFQAYDEKAVTESIRQAVAATRGQVLTYAGRFVYAEFHALSHDMTADITESFPRLAEKAPYLVPVPTAGLNYAPEKYRDWAVSVSQEEIAQMMGLTEKLHSFTVSRTGPSGRALEITANGGQAVMHATEFRQAVGFDRLFSTYWTSVVLDGGDIVFHGSGWGHGAGMEQWGAYARAEAGDTAEQILAHYYPDSRLLRLYP